MNIMDYIRWRGDILFSEKGLNEVDNLIFSEFAYAEMEGLPAEGDEGMTVAQLSQAYSSSEHEHKNTFNNPREILELAAQSERFKNVTVKWYVSEIDGENNSQFAAATFFYADGEAYVAFRGTDDTIVGWREDFSMAFLEETPGQRSAVKYLTDVAAKTGCRLTVGGHSKGGNFAVYAAAFSDPEILEKRIVRIYSNDGPGFRSDIAESGNILAATEKTIKLVPDSSIVGILLSGTEERHFIKSSAKGFSQHDPFTWSVLGARFERAENRSAMSEFVERTLDSWLGTLSHEKRQKLVELFFDSLVAGGADTFGQINDNKLNASRAFLKAISETDSDSKSEVMAMFKTLISSGVDVMRVGIKKDPKDPPDTA